MLQTQLIYQDLYGVLPDHINKLRERDPMIRRPLCELGRASASVRRS